MSNSTTVTGWLDHLSPRKREIVDGIRDGLGRKEIAARMSVSPETIKQYTRDIYQRAGVHTARELLSQLMDQHDLSWASDFFSVSLTTRAEVHQALLAKARELAPRARPRLMTVEAVPPAARGNLARGKCWTGEVTGEAGIEGAGGVIRHASGGFTGRAAGQNTGADFCAPYWAPPDYAAVAVRAHPPLTPECAQRLHLLAALAQVRLAWLANSAAGRPNAQA